MIAKNDISAKVCYTDCGDRIRPAFRGNAIPVFLSCDDKFLWHAIAVVASIMENGSPDNNYDILVIGDDLNFDKLVASLDWMKRYPNGNLRFINAADCFSLSQMSHFYVTKAFPISVYFRFFAPMLFSNYDRIIYLDSDLVVLADMAELYRTDIGDALLGAVHDFMHEEELPSGSSYFNSGVLLLNLGKMRAENIQEKLIDAVKDFDAPSLPDQDILNAVCKGKVAFIDMVWNFQEWMAETERTSVKFRFSRPAIQMMCFENKANCRVLHYTENKPWNFRYTGTKGGYYWKYAAMTPFLGQIQAELRRQSSIKAKVFECVYLLFHLSRCILPYPAAAEIRKKRFRRRIFNYWLQLKMLFCPTAIAKRRNMRF